ncbi:MAG: hypothetical protein IJ272_05105 [Clostridia bacterium]|nr:hypothetical protein [Clostridia bacterium]
MKKANLLKCLVVICIILSFFSCVYANTYFEVGESNVTEVLESTTLGSTTITANADKTKNDYGAVTISPKGTGVFTIDVEGITKNSEEDLYYVLTDSKGKEVRLAAYYDATSNSYVTFTNGNDKKSTKVDVLLEAGETYTLKLSKKKATPQTSTASSYNSPIYEYTYVTAQNPSEDYKIIIKVNDAANRKGSIYQSNISSIELSEDTKTKEENLEIIDNEKYKLPPGFEATLDNYDVGNAVSDAASTVGGIVTEYVANPFEETVCELLLAIGDFFVNLINQIVGEDVTITALVYNQVDSVNPNFFDDSVSGKGITANLKEAITTWYNVFKLVAVAVYIIALLAVGINILLASTGKGMEKVKELLGDWLKGVIFLFFIPYVMKYAFLLNEAIVDTLREEADVPSYAVGSSGGSSANEWSAEEIEFRSPEFVSNYTGKVAFGSDEASEGYIKRIQSYEQNFDLMRIMRAYAGVTKKFIYVIIWFILIGQLISFIVQYYKRYFMIAFLIAMFPLICIFYGISVARGIKKKTEIGSWMKELFANIFIQMVQAIIYTVITSVCVSVVSQDIQSSATLNWIVIILAINFVSEGEKLLRKIIGAMGSTVGGTGQTGQGIKGAVGKVKDGFNKLSGH